MKNFGWKSLWFLSEKDGTCIVYSADFEQHSLLSG